MTSTMRLLLSFISLWISFVAVSQDHNSNYYLYVGTYTHGESESKGIYLYKFDTHTGKASPLIQATESEDPSYLTISSDHKHLYAVQEVVDNQAENTGYVNAYAIDSQSGKLSFINKQKSEGGAPCYITVDEAKKNVLVGNYVGGNVAVLPLQEDGSLQEASDIKKHKGSSVNTARQEAPHVHGVVLSPNNRYVYVPDLGIDQVVIYTFDSETSQLNYVDEAKLRPGFGPRHFTFHPNQKFAYLVNELGHTITAFSHDRGHLKELQEVPTLPKSFQGNNSCADIHVSPSGRFLYASNRGHNSIVIYAIDPQEGTLSLVGHESTQGKTPRNFMIDPSGKYLLAANQASNSIVVFEIDPANGKLSANGEVIQAPSPVCLKMIPVQE